MEQTLEPFEVKTTIECLNLGLYAAGALSNREKPGAANSVPLSRELEIQILGVPVHDS